MLNLALLLVGLGFAVLQALIGGSRLVYALPACALLGLAGLAVVRVAPAPETRRPSLWCLLSAAALGLDVCGRSWMTAVEYLARPDFFTALAALVVYFLAALHFTGARERFALIAALLALAFFHVAAGAAQFRSGDDHMMIPWIVRPMQYFSRASGFYVSPDHLAGLLEMLAVLSLAIFCWSHSRFATYVLAAYGVAACLVGIAISGSPASNFSVIAAFGVTAAISIWVVRILFPKRLMPVVAVSTSLLAVLGISAATFFSGEERLSSRAGVTVEKPDFRPILNGLALQIHQLNPVFGAGSGSYLYHARRLRPTEMQSEPQHAQSDYLEFLAEYGYVGAGLAALFLGAHLCSGVAGLTRIVRERTKAIKAKRSRELALCIGSLGAIAALLFHAATDFSLHLPANAVLAAFIFGMLANPGRGLARREGAKPVRPPDAWMRFLAPAAGAALLVFAVPRVLGEFHGERARLALRDQQYFRARDSAERALRSEHKNPDLYYYRGEASHYLGLEQPDSDTRFQRYTEAAGSFAEGLKLFPQDTRLLLKMGRTLDNLGRFEEATPYFERAIAADPNLGAAHARSAVHWQMQGQVEKAKEFYQKAGELGENSVVPAGLADLEKVRDQPFRRPQRPNVLIDFITEPEVVKEEPESVKLFP